MADEIQALKQLQRRQRDAAERLLSDSGLREALTDAQAGRLLHWSLDYVNAAAIKTVNMSPAAADTYMDDLVTAVRRALRSVNRLVGELAALDDDQAVHQVRRCLANLYHLTGRAPPSNQVDPLLAPDRPNWNREQIFQRLMQLIEPDQEEE